MNLPEANSREEPFQKRAVIDNLYRHVKFLSVDIGDRYLWKESSLERAAEYIEAELASYGYPVRRQSFGCYGKEVSNLIIKNPGGEGLKTFRPSGPGP